MSYGAISAPAVRALSRGAAEAGCWMDTGEGGLSPYHLEGKCDVIMQIGTAKYGIRDLKGNFSPEKARELAKVVKAFRKNDRALIDAVATMLYLTSLFHLPIANATAITIP